MMNRCRFEVIVDFKPKAALRSGSRMLYAGTLFWRHKQ
jgi:hypothetical protein